MKKQIVCFIISFVLILISTPLGYALIGIIYKNKNLSGEFVYILNGFIYSIMIVGILISVIGFIQMILNNKKES